jgi:hypothetical protein
MMLGRNSFPNLLAFLSSHLRVWEEKKKIALFLSKRIGKFAKNQLAFKGRTVLRQNALFLEREFYHVRV